MKVSNQKAITSEESPERGLICRLQIACSACHPAVKELHPCCLCTVSVGRLFFASYFLLFSRLHNFGIAVLKSGIFPDPQSSLLKTLWRSLEC